MAKRQFIQQSVGFEEDLRDRIAAYADARGMEGTAQAVRELCRKALDPIDGQYSHMARLDEIERRLADLEVFLMVVQQTLIGAVALVARRTKVEEGPMTNEEALRKIEESEQYAMRQVAKAAKAVAASLEGRAEDPFMSDLLASSMERTQTQEGADA